MAWSKPIYNFLYVNYAQLTSTEQYLEYPKLSICSVSFYLLFLFSVWNCNQTCSRKIFSNKHI